MPNLPPTLFAFRRPSAGVFATLVLAFGLAACAAAPPSSSPGGSSVPSASSGAPSGSPSASASGGVGAIDHPTGATDIVLRMDRGGGFVPLDFLAVEAPIFTLFGNGIIVFQQKVEAFPQPDASGVIHNIPWRTAKLDEDHIQELLGFAITQGGLGTARDVYMANIADAPSTTFTVHAGGLDKTVNVHALSEATADSPDAAARTAFLRLAQRLEDFDRSGTISSDVFEPSAYRGILATRDADGSVLKAWPWPTIKPADFEEGPNDGSGGILLPHRTMTLAEVAALGIQDAAGGLQGVPLTGPDGKIYGFSARPLLVDEKE
jgi:hypothetical protein